jgi:hypothetical protein
MGPTDEPREVRLTDEKSEHDREAMRQLVNSMKIVAGVHWETDDTDKLDILCGIPATEELGGLVRTLRDRPPERTNDEEEKLYEQIEDKLEEILERQDANRRAIMEQSNEPVVVEMKAGRTPGADEALRELARHLKEAARFDVAFDLEDYDGTDEELNAGELFVTSLVSHVCAVSRLNSLVNKFRLRPPERTDHQQQAISEQIAYQISRVNTHRATISAWEAVTVAATRAAAQQQEEA